MNRVTVPERVMVRRLGDEYVLLDVASGIYFGLDVVGARIWQLLSENHSAPEIADQLAQEFDVTREQAASDLAHLVDELSANGLLALD